MTGPRKVGSAPSGGGGTPGGDPGQLQYNADGAFAGVPGSEITNDTHTLMRIDPTETYAGIMRVSQVGSGATARLEAAAGDEVALVEVSAGTFKGVSLSSMDNAGTTSSVQADLNGVSAVAAGDGLAARLSLNGETGASITATDDNSLTATVIAEVNSGTMPVISISVGDGADSTSIQALAGSVTVSSPQITLDSVAVFLPGLPSYADETAARAAGLTDNQLYVSAGVVRRVVPVT